jgi:hypothetical protein
VHGRDVSDELLVDRRELADVLVVAVFQRHAARRWRWWRWWRGRSVRGSVRRGRGGRCARGQYLLHAVVRNAKRPRTCTMAARTEKCLSVASNTAATSAAWGWAVRTGAATST